MVLLISFYNSGTYHELAMNIHHSSGLAWHLHRHRMAQTANRGHGEVAELFQDVLPHGHPKGFRGLSSQVFQGTWSHLETLLGESVGGRWWQILDEYDEWPYIKLNKTNISYNIILKWDEKNIKRTPSETMIHWDELIRADFFEKKIHRKSIEGWIDFSKFNQWFHRCRLLVHTYWWDHCLCSWNNYTSFTSEYHLLLLKALKKTLVSASNTFWRKNTTCSKHFANTNTGSAAHKTNMTLLAPFSLRCSPTHVWVIPVSHLKFWGSIHWTRWILWVWFSTLCPSKCLVLQWFTYLLCMYACMHVWCTCPKQHQYLDV